MSATIQKLMKLKYVCMTGVSNSNILLSLVYLDSDTFYYNEISEKKVTQTKEKNQIKLIDNTKKCRDPYFIFRIEILLRKPRKIRLKKFTKSCL